MLTDLFPRVADNRYRGQKLALWLFALMLVKIVMGINVMINAPTIARTADGIPVETFGGAGGEAFLSMFAAWGLCQLVFGLTCLVLLIRYRSLIPLAYLGLLLEQGGRKLLQLRWHIERVGNPPGKYINAAILAILIAGFILSLWRRRGVAGDGIPPNTSATSGPS